jgi:hypothetical protein
MASAVQPLTIEEFRSRYRDQKPYFEYSFGEAIQKTVPAWLHAVLQGIMVQFLVRAGYRGRERISYRARRCVAAIRRTKISSQASLTAPPDCLALSRGSIED